MCILITLGFLIAGLITGDTNLFLVASIFGIGAAIEVGASRIAKAIESKIV